MDLLKTILLYMSLTFATSVQMAPPPVDILNATPVPTAYVQPPTPTPIPTPTPTPVPTINITPNPAYKTLTVGDRGDQVRALQEKLAEYGYLTGDIDGAYGNQTRQAVEKFQYQHGLSVDGIAGRHTLTVLFESDEVRLSPDVTPSPTPRPTSQLTVAITPEPTQTPAPTPTPSPTPTPMPTFVPVETVKAADPTATPKPTATPRPTATPVPPMMVLEGYSIELEWTETPIDAPVCVVENRLYLPLVKVLEAAEILVIEASSVETDELAFAIGENLFRIAYTENQQGEPVHLEAYRNTEPQILTGRDIRRLDDVLYLPVQCIEQLTGIAAWVDEDAKCVIVSIP